MGEIVTFDGVPHRVVYSAVGDYVRSDGKGHIPGINFFRVEPV